MLIKKIIKLFISFILYIWMIFSVSANSQVNLILDEWDVKVIDNYQVTNITDHKIFITITDINWKLLWNSQIDTWKYYWELLDEVDLNYPYEIWWFRLENLLINDFCYAWGPIPCEVTEYYWDIWNRDSSCNYWIISQLVICKNWAWNSVDPSFCTWLPYPSWYEEWYITWTCWECWTTNNICIEWTTNDITDSTTEYLWNCDWSINEINQDDTSCNLTCNQTSTFDYENWYSTLVNSSFVDYTSKVEIKEPAIITGELKGDWNNISSFNWRYMDNGNYYYWDGSNYWTLKPKNPMTHYVSSASDTYNYDTHAILANQEWEVILLYCDNDIYAGGYCMVTQYIDNIQNPSVNKIYYNDFSISNNILRVDNANMNINNVGSDTKNYFNSNTAYDFVTVYSDGYLEYGTINKYFGCTTYNWNNYDCMKTGKFNFGGESCIDGSSPINHLCSLFSCPDGYIETWLTGNNACKKTVSYKYYNYLCSTENYIATDIGWDCNPSLITDLIDTNSDGIGDSCNLATPPIDNCKAENFICDSNFITPINWTCWTTNNICTTWTLSDILDSSIQYLWNCNWIDWWSNSSCSEDKVILPSTCSVTLSNIWNCSVSRNPNWNSYCVVGIDENSWTVQFDSSCYVKHVDNRVWSGTLIYWQSTNTIWGTVITNTSHL